MQSLFIVIDPVLRIRDPVPFWPLDPGRVKNKDPDPGLNNPYHISNSLETIFWVKNLNSSMRIRGGKTSESGSGME
jgi:hypothetical protein